MKDDSNIEVCLLPDDNDLSQDTPLYKYLSIEAFLYLIEFNRLSFSRFASWPDAYEGFRFEFFKSLKEHPEFKDTSKNDFWGSCWTLQTDDSCLYADKKEYTLAIDELLLNGSASMWESYCKNGGVRIKTTLGKINNLLAHNFGDLDIFRGKAFYEPATSWNRTTKSTNLATTLFMKRVSFRHEAEYRFILIAKSPSKKTILSAPIADLFEFLDEILIAPAISSRQWISRTLYNIAVDISIDHKRRGISINNKDGTQFCKISQLYGTISEVVGHSNMG
jgi:hypothetical protein